LPECRYSDLLQVMILDPKLLPHIVQLSFNPFCQL
jgi:hypothetical protein